MSNGRVEYTFLWFIENYSYCWHKNGERLFSPILTTDELKSKAWRLWLYPRGYREVDKGYISLFLVRSGDDEGPQNVSIEYELSILAPKGPRICSGKRGLGWNQMAGGTHFLQLDEIRLRRKEDYLPNNTLSVRCKIWMGQGSVRRFAPIILGTRIAIENISFPHLVDQFSALQPNQRKTVKINSHSKTGCVVSSDVYCSEGKILVEIKPSDSNYILCKLKISLLDGSGNIIGCDEEDIRLDAEIKNIQKLTLDISRQDILNKKHEYLPDDILTLLCQCSFSTGLDFRKKEIQYETPTAAVDLSKSTAVLSNLSINVDAAIKKSSAFPSLVEDIKTLYINQCLTDVELKTEKRSFKAHKLVLCIRSPVFNAMLTSDREKHNNCIQVDDLDDDIVQQLLLFLYSDAVENLQWNNAVQLYYAADKYQICGLKELCSSFLAENLSTSNVTELLLLADTHNDTELKKSVEDFILKHEEQVFGSIEWEKFIETNPLLAAKIMDLKYKRKKN